MSAGPVGIGVVGAGNISDEYLTSLTSYPDLIVRAITDIDLGRASSQATNYGVEVAPSVEALLARDDIEIVVNLTLPATHAEIALRALASGKHVWSEKPIALSLDDARAVLTAADERGLVVGNAPDTILGEGIQNSHRLLAEGAIGTPQTVLTLMQGPGPDAWHPRPQFLFARGAGPLFDIGPYYFTTMVQLIGEIETVEALGSRPRDERVVGSGPDAGQTFPVEIFTHLSVLTRFRSGVVGTSVFSFDSPVRRQLFEITGSAGTMEVPVSGFDGDTRILTSEARDAEWTAYEAPGIPRQRGVGVLEMARALRTGRSARASGALALHVLEAMAAVEESAASGLPVPLTTHVDDVQPVDKTWDPTRTTLGTGLAPVTPTR
ncbi:MAG: Gfo/Idh/MocA family oxidoreductase [Frondihabitans sp.]|nr:Gfo/Idh/MocA family oxidoreductase [Frondihabitans sp.]